MQMHGAREATKTAMKRPPRCSWLPAACFSIRTVFVLLSVIQITVCAVLVGYLGYSSAVNTTTKLAREIADERFHRVRSAVDTSLTPLLASANDLHDWLQPMAGQIVTSNTVANVSGFWFQAMNKLRRNLAWKQPFIHSYGCSIGNNTMVFLPQTQAPRILFVIADATTSPGKSLNGIFTANPYVQNASQWNTFVVDVAPNATYQSLLAAGQLSELQSNPYVATLRPWYVDAVSHGSSPVWIQPFVARDGQYLLGAAQGIVLNPGSAPVGACLAQMPVSTLHEAVTAIPAAQRAPYMIIRSSGRLLATSVSSLASLVATVNGDAQYLQNSSLAQQSPLLQAVLPIFYQWQLMSPIPGAIPEQALPSPDTVLSVAAHIEGRSYLCRIGLLNTPGFRAFITTCFDEADFDDGADRLLGRAILTTLLVLLTAVASTLLLLHFVWRGVDQVTRFMSALEHVSYGNPANAPDGQKPDSAGITIRQMAQHWDTFLRTGVPPAELASDRCSCWYRWWCRGTLSTPLAVPRRSSRSGLRTVELHTLKSAPSRVALMETDADEVKIDDQFQVGVVQMTAGDHPQASSGCLDRCTVGCFRAAACCCRDRKVAVLELGGADDQSRGNSDELDNVKAAQSSILTQFQPSRANPESSSTSFVGFACELFEPALMRRTFGGMLRSICSHQDEVERANEAKRHFIRYIFHEVRVPFNSVVLCK